MEETTRSTYFINNLLFILNQVKTDNLEKNIRDFKNMISKVELKDKEKSSLYAKCLKALRDINDLEKEEYLTSARSVCCYFLELSDGTRYNKTKYDNDYRKKHYKQLNIDIPIEKMEKFEKILNQEKKTKKEVIIKLIEDYINKK